MSEFKGGIKRTRAKTGKVDPMKVAAAKYATTSMGGYRDRTAGMLIDFVNNPSYTSGFRLDAYRTSYANGLNQRSGVYDIPTYFQDMNNKNGGNIYWPITLQEKYSWYRYFYITDPYIGRAIDLLTDLPMSKLTLSVPKTVPEEFRKEISDFFEYQLERIDAFVLLQNILREIHIIGGAFVFHEWDDKMKMWGKAVVLPPEETYIFYDPFSTTGRVEYRPERLMGIIKAQAGVPGSPTAQETSASQLPGSGFCDRQIPNEELISHIPDEIIDMVQKQGCIVMDTDPSSGSFVAHLDRRRFPYHDLAPSQLERVCVPMIQKEYLKYTQLSLLNRNMTPKNIISAEGLMPEEVEALREQVDLSNMNPDFAVVTNYVVNWEQIGAQDRLIDLSREYEHIDNQIFAALGVTRELLTGESTLSGGRITVEILNTMFLHSREALTNYVEKQLFKPICEARGWFSVDKNGIKKHWYPRLGFNRLSIRDNAEMFDSLYQLYVKNSLPVDVIYDLLNLDSDKMAEKLRNDLFTVKDATFNRLVEEVNVEVGRALVEKTDISSRIAEYLGMQIIQAASPESGIGGDMGGDSGGYDFGDSSAQGEGGESEESGTQEQEDVGVDDAAMEVESLAQQIADELPEKSTVSDVQKGVQKAIEIDQDAEALLQTLPAGATESEIRQKVESQIEQKAIELAQKIPGGITKEELKNFIQREVSAAFRRKP